MAERPPVDMKADVQKGVKNRLYLLLLKGRPVEIRSCGPIEDLRAPGRAKGARRGQHHVARWKDLRGGVHI